jgi:hypothetical protein
MEVPVRRLLKRDRHRTEINIRGERQISEELRFRNVMPMLTMFGLHPVPLTPA